MWPTHGAGSFCAAPPGAARTTTIRREKEINPFLRVDLDAFVEQLSSSLGEYPHYFRDLPEVNRRGPAILTGAPSVPRLSASEVQRQICDGAVLIDVRPVAAFGASHIPGALSIPLRPQFATWLGWLVAPGSRLIFVHDRRQDLGDIAWQALKVGHENLAGALDDGLTEWVATGRPVHHIDVVDPATAADLARDKACDGPGRWPR